MSCNWVLIIIKSNDVCKKFVSKGTTFFAIEILVPLKDKIFFTI